MTGTMRKVKVKLCVRIVCVESSEHLDRLAAD